jgi:ATP-dependent helicase/nuclease subunit A
VHHYIRALTEEGLPWQAEGGEDFFSSTEVSVALSLLQVVDNPRRMCRLFQCCGLRSGAFTADGWPSDARAL